MKNVIKLQSVLFAVLIGTMIISFNMEEASAEELTPIYDPVTYNYIENLISEIGRNTETRIIDGKNISVLTVVSQGSNDSRYKVKVITTIDGERNTLGLFKIIENDDDTYKLVNKKLGIKQVFTNVTSNEVFGDGSGHSNASGARIDLYDRESGTPHTLRLYDNYSACGTLNQAVMEAVVRSNTVDVTWEASPFYLHWCLIPHQFNQGSLQYGTETIVLNTQSDRRSSHTFINTHIGTTWYSVEVDFEYGTW